MEKRVKALNEKYFKLENLPKPPNLPVNDSWPDIRDSIDNNEVTIVVGSTGSGKTTQIPQLLLENELYHRKKFCRIVITQPRRLAAMSISRTVCSQRNWPLGSICGYQVAMDKEVSDDTCIQYVTTNVLNEIIINQKSTERYTHIIIDEVHERHQDLDCLLYLLKTLPEKTGVKLKIILMSATAETNIYLNYFGLDKSRCFFVEGKMYPTEIYYLDDIPLKISNTILTFIESKQMRTPFEKEPPSRGYLMLHTDVMKAVADLVESLDQLDVGGVRGSVLIFLPGVNEISQMTKVLDHRKEKCRFETMALHSKVPLEEQHRAFKSVPATRRKIIVSTNIAESSITVPDIRYVIDFCLVKQQVMDSETGFAYYHVDNCSRANCAQRAGRAGRVQAGVVFRLIKRHEFKSLQEFPTPEILRCPVDITVLKIKRFGLEKPKDVLEKFIDPPKSEDISRAILALKESQAMQLEHQGKVDREDGDLTIMGHVMARLPLNIRLSKLILMGFAFGCFDECVKMAACLSVEEILLPLPSPLDNYKNKINWARGHFSDPLLLMNAFNEYLMRKDQFGSANDSRVLRTWAQQNGLQFRRLVEVYQNFEDLKRRLSMMGFVKPPAPNLKPREPSLQNFFVMMALCGAFYPYYYCQNPIDYSIIKGHIDDHNPMNTMIISGFPHMHGPLYAQTIRAILSECFVNDVQLSFRGMDAFLSFKNKENDGVPIDAYFCELYRIMTNAITVPRVPDDVAERLLKKLGITVDDEDSLETEIQILPIANELASNLKKPPLPTEQISRGTLTWFEDILTFYINLEERQTEFDNLASEIRDERDRYQHRFMKLDQPQVGSTVFAEIELQLFRAQVLPPAKEQSAFSGRTSANISVFLIDYGRTERVTRVYQMPERMLLCNNVAPFAYRAQLAHLKLPDGILGKPVALQKLTEGKQCRVEIFSIVDDTLRVTLFVEVDDEEVNVNEKLIYDKLVIHDQEAEFSKDKSRFETVQNLVIKGEHHLDLNEYSLNKLFLNGPRTPLSKCGLTTMNRLHYKRGADEKTIEVCSKSVNYIMFGQTGINQRFLVSHMAKLAANRKRVQLLQTTLMTKLPMMLPFVSLVFSPRAEYRYNKNETKLIGALCGMGALETEAGEFVAVNPNSDIEVPFTQQLDRNDAKLINEIRKLLNEAFRSNKEIYEWTSVPILKIQKKIENYVLKFFNAKDRVEIPWTQTRKLNAFKWGLLDLKTCSIAPESLRQSLFRPHPVPRVKNAEMYEILELTKSFLSQLNDVGEHRMSLCPLCCITFESCEEAIEHIKTREHKIRYAKLKGTGFDEEIP